MKTCFISAARNADTSYLKESLSRRGAQILEMDNISVGMSIMASLQSRISKADIFIAVLPEAKGPKSADLNNLMFALGIAIGLGKQTLIFAPSGDSLLPLDLSGVVKVRASIANREAVDFAVSQTLFATEKHRSMEREEPVPGKVLGDSVDQMLAQYRLIADHQDAYLERLVARAIGESGVDVMSPAGPDGGFDFVVWSDGLQSSVGNPLVVEIRSKVSSKAHLKRVAEQLSAVAEDKASGWSLLVYGEGPKNQNVMPMPRGVLTISVVDLLQAMRTASFVSVVRELRNRYAHGASDGRH